MSGARGQRGRSSPRAGGRVPHRRGTIYLAVLAIAMLVFVIGVGGMMASRVKSREASLGSDLSAARSHAASAIALGRRWMAIDPDWRTNRSGAAWLTSLPFSDGLISLEVSNPKGTLDRSSLDPVVMTATGERGGARQLLRVTLTPDPRAMSSLEVAWCAWGTISVNKLLTAPGLTIAANGDFKSNSASVNADVEAGGSITGSGYSGAKHAGVAPRGLPKGSAVLAEYALIGSEGALSGVPIMSGERTIQNQLIGPGNAPFGAAQNASGVYILDCKNNTIALKNVRVVGTIVFKNCANLRLKGPVFWSPGVSNYPCIIVDGPVTIDTAASALYEAAITTNLNPTKAPYPYPSGTWNTTSADYYPCGINGLIYASGTLTVEQPGWWLGPVVVGGGITLNESVSVLPRPEYASSPPPGFADVAMVPTLWEQVVD